MQRILKYHIRHGENVVDVTGEQVFVLSVIEQHDEAVIYIVTDDKEGKKEVTLMAFETGEYFNLIPYGYFKFIGTVKLNGGYYILHIFQVRVEA